MHPASFHKMKKFVQSLPASTEPRVVVDYGSYDVNGTYKPLFPAPWKYIGIDMAKGPNVDIALADVYHWTELADASADVVVSGQAFEHTEYVWLTMQEIARILKPGGRVCVIAPSAGPEHRYPLDCWRIYPDGMRALAKYAGLTVISAQTDFDADPRTWRKRRDRGELVDPMWKDTTLIAEKPK